MSVLEDVKPSSKVFGIAPGEPVEVVAVEWIGNNQAINAVCRAAARSIFERTLYRCDEHHIAVEERGRQWSFDGDGALLPLGRPIRGRTRGSNRALNVSIAHQTKKLATST